MNILHITPYYAPAWSFGGVVRMVHGLATAQAAQGHQVTVLTTDALDRAHRVAVQHEVIDGVEVHRLRNLSMTLRGRANFSTPLGFEPTVRGLLARDTDVVHLHEVRTAEALILPADRPIVVSPHGTLAATTGRSALKRVWDSTLGKRAAQKFSLVCALTADEAREAEQYWTQLGLPFPGAAVIPNGVPDDFSAQVDSVRGDLDGLRARFGLRERPMVMFFSRLSPRKGLDLLVSAFAEVIDTFSDARLLVCGADEGVEADLKARVIADGLGEQVIFAGHLDGADRLRAYACADVFALPAEGEGQPVAALEAMAAGVPCLLTPGCNLPELDARGAGITVAREVSAIAAGLHDLLGDPARRADMGARGRAWINGELTWGRLAGQYIEAYRRTGQTHGEG